MNIFEKVKFDEKGLVPAIVQDYKNGTVLMMAYMNKEALEKTIKTGKTHFWSRSRQELWLKGETSGHFQFVKEIRIDCDEDCLLIMAEQVEAACHTNNYSCFYREVDGEDLKEKALKSFTSKDKSRVLQDVYDIIVDRVKNPKEGSYTNYLFEKGIDKMLKKVGEETSEVIIAAKNNDKGEITYEVSDLIYHLLVVLVENKVTLEDIFNELEKRK